MNPLSEDRRRPGSKYVLFRTTLDQVLALAEALPDDPQPSDLEPLRNLLLSAQKELEGDRELDNRMHNILTVISLSTHFLSPSELVEWIKQSVRR